MYPEISLKDLRCSLLGILVVFIAILAVFALIPNSYVQNIVRDYYFVNVNCGIISKRIQVSFAVHIFFTFFLSICFLLIALTGKPKKQRIQISFINGSISIVIFLISYTTLSFIALPPSLFPGQHLCFDLINIDKSLTYIAASALVTYLAAVSASIAIGSWR
ncbi:hypothetical protein DBIPINDM_006230 [Mesorhizobium sp. AR02]|uniref:hypothetical protein n=1 Tax=Mesorhizobium sp. AR02 TaxID=2865837 RepID=UPI0021603F11|nr:hypothetical protein [Mesorhizobium sp. AR02]UVK52814.1 hypothetical protein DBIPINDM_006230 [Mesorhizobium sp. AR02]